MEPYDYCEYSQDRGTFVCVCSFFFFVQTIGFFGGFLPFSPFPSLFFQFATSLKEVLDNWNICTVLWLRRYVVIFLLIEWEGRTGKYLARGHNVHFRFFFFSSFSSHLVGAIDHFWPSSNHHKGPPYGGVFVKCFSVKARGGPDGSYDNSYYDIWSKRANKNQSGRRKLPVAPGTPVTKSLLVF